MIYLLWAAVVGLAIWLLYVTVAVGVNATINEDFQRRAVGWHKVIIEKLRLVGQHID